jgi:RND family efflux transporter MFP subunit
MKRIHRSISLAVLLIVLVIPVSTALASNSPSQNGTVTASAVVVPAKISRMAFLISAPVKEVLVKEGDSVQAGQKLIVLNTPDLEFAVTAADAAYRLEQANVALQNFKKVKHRENGVETWQDAPPEVRRDAEAKASRAQALMEFAQATLAQNTLTAPYDGTIADIKVVPGELVQQGQAVIALATLTNLQIETTDLSERDILKVKVGDKATVSIKALNGNFIGKVVAIAPKADVLGGDVVFKVTIALGEQPKGLLWGMTAEVTIDE